MKKGPFINNECLSIKYWGYITNSALKIPDIKVEIRSNCGYQYLLANVGNIVTPMVCIPIKLADKVIKLYNIG